MKIVERADVFLENFTPGTMDKLNLGYESRFPGQSEDRLLLHFRVRPGGTLSRPAGVRPGRPGHVRNHDQHRENLKARRSAFCPPWSTTSPGNHMAYAIAVALLDRQKTGKGKRIEIALLDVAIMQMGQFVAMYTMTGELPQRMGSGYLAAAPYQAFETQEGYVLIAVTTDEMWKNLCRVLKLDHLYENPKYSSLEGRVKSRPELAAEVNQVTRRYKSKDLENLLVEGSVPCGRLMNIDEIIADPHVQFRNIMADVEDPERGKIKIIKTPIFVSGKPPEIKKRAPLIGEHTAEILAELGYTQEEIQDFFKTKVAVQQEP